MLTDIPGVSGRAMIETLIAGRRSPTALAELAKGRARARRDALTEALDGRFTDHHARLAQMLLSQLDDLTARIIEVTALLDAAITALPHGRTSTDPAANTDATDRSKPTPASYASAVARLCMIPGAGPDSVRAVIGEIGLDMTVFGRHQRLCSGRKYPPAPCSPAAKKAGPKQARATPTSKPRLPRWPSAPPKPTPSSASATDG